MSHLYEKPECTCGDDLRKIIRVIGFTAGNDFEVELDCGHEALLDSSYWMDTRRGPKLIADEAYCCRCEDECPVCSR